MAFVNVKTYGATGNGVTDDTAAINSALTAASAVGQEVFVPAGVYAISGLVDVPATVALVGSGSGDYTHVLGTVFKATNAAAKIRFGDPLVTPQAGGQNGGFTVDGNRIATSPFTVSLVNAKFDDIKVINSAGDGWVFDGAQNCIATQCAVAHSLGVGLVFDRGCGSNLLVQWEIQANSTWMVEFRMSNGLGPQGNTVPVYNRLFRCNMENIGSSVWATAGTGLVHMLAGQGNAFVESGFADNTRTTAGDAMLIEPNTVSGRSADVNGRWTFSDCGWVGSANHALNVNAIRVAGNPACDYLLYFVGCNDINNYGTGVNLSATANGNIKVAGSILFEFCGANWAGGLNGYYFQVQTPLYGRLVNQFSQLEYTTATAGVNGAPPAQVVGYLEFLDSTGANRKIPYYAV